METTRVKYGTNERIFATISDSSGTPVTGLTDVLLEIYRRSDGKYFDFNDSSFKSSGWTTRQGAMAELSASNSPGVYYYDFDTTGHSSAFVEESYFMTVTSATAVNDPLYGELKVGGYVDQIGISGGVVQYGKDKGMTAAQVKKMAELVWQVVLKNEKTAEETLLSKSEFNAATDQVLTGIEIPEFTQTDRTDEVLEAVAGLPKPKDYSKDIQAVGKRVEGLIEEVKPVVKDFQKSVSGFNENMIETAKNLGIASDLVAQMQEKFIELQKTTEEYQVKLSEASDMDKRFDSMASALNKRNLEDVAAKIEKTQEELKNMVRRILVALTQNKFDILQELTITK